MTFCSCPIVDYSRTTSFYGLRNNPKSNPNLQQVRVGGFGRWFGLGFGFFSVSSSGLLLLHNFSGQMGLVGFWLCSLLLLLRRVAFCFGEKWARFCDFFL
jgi:hypothetical protein